MSKHKSPLLNALILLIGIVTLDSTAQVAPIEGVGTTACKKLVPEDFTAEASVGQ